MFPTPPRLETNRVKTDQNHKGGGALLGGTPNNGFGPVFTGLKLTNVPLSFLELNKAAMTLMESFALVIPTLKQRQSEYIYSPTMTSLTHHLITAKRAFRLFCKLWGECGL